LVAAVDERSRRERGNGLLECVVDARGGDDDVRRREVAAEPRRAALHPVSLRREILEEVLDEVLLRQVLEHLDLLDRDRRLVGNCAREIELARAGRDERAEQLVAGDE